MIGYERIKGRIKTDENLDIYEEIAGHKEYKKIYMRISCVEEDILTYHKQISGAGKFFPSFPAFFSHLFLKDPKP